MRVKFVLLGGLFFLFSLSLHAQQTGKTKAGYHGTVGSVEYVSSLASRPHDRIAPDNTKREAKDKRSLDLEKLIVPGKDPQTQDDYFVRHRHESAQSKNANPPSLVFDAYTSNSSPTDPSLAVGPDHVLVVFNTGFAIYDKSGVELVGETSPNPAIFPSGGCCDLTASYDNAADRWVLSFLGAGAQIAVSDGPDPVNDGWYIYNIPQIDDYQKLSVWSDGYYLTDNSGSSMKVWAMERAAMLTGDPSAGIVSFDLPGLTSSGFISPQVLNVTNNNLPDAGGATVVYLQDDAWFGVATDHIKLWTIDVDWVTPANSTVSAAQEIPTTPFISVFDNGAFDNLDQPGGGADIDALQAIIMNQAQFRKFDTHNSAVFNFVVDTDAGPGELAGVRWMELRQSDDNQPWSLYQEGTYTAPDGRHAWNASLAMDAAGNIGMGYTSMSGPETTSTVRVSSYYTGRMAGDPLGTMTVEEGLIGNGDQNIPNFRYGDYSKIDVDPANDLSFWFINEYMRSSRTGIVGVFQIQTEIVDIDPPSTPADLVVSMITTGSANLDWTASIDDIAVDHYNIYLDGSPVGTSPTNSFMLSGLSPGTTYTVAVEAEDAAGNISGQVSELFTTLEGGELEVIMAYYFETGLDGWSDPGEDCRRVATNKAYEGSYAIRLRDGSASSFSESPVLDLSGNTEVTIEFHTYSRSMEADDNIIVEFFNGFDYEVVGSYNSGSDFSNLSFFSPSHIVLDAATYDFNAENRFRIRCEGDDNNDKFFFDQVIIRGDHAPGLAPPAPAAAQPQNALVMQTFAQQTASQVRLYPNPSTDLLNIDLQGQQFDEILILSATGELIYRWNPSDDTLSISLEPYAKGMYFVRFVSDGLATTLRFVKQ